MQHPDHLRQQHALQISTFACARDNRATLQSTTFEDLVLEISTPAEIHAELAYDSDALTSQKEALPAWSPAQFVQDLRSNDGVQSCSCLVFDLDTGSDGLKQGLTEQDFEKLLKLLEELNVSWAVHTSFTSGFFHPRKKLRLVFPLASPITADEYVKLWDTYATKLPAPPDRTRRHPGGLFFAPAVLAKHKDTYTFMSDTNKPLLSVSQLQGFGLNKARVGDERHYAAVQVAENKQNALNAAAFTLALEKYPKSFEEIKAEVWPRLKTALENNTVSDPVKSWAEAERHCEKGIREGWKKADKREKDPLKELRVQPVSEKRKRRAELDLKKHIRAIEKDPSKLGAAAQALGRWLPNGWLDEDEVIKQLTIEAAGAGIDNNTAASVIAVGLATGKARPIAAVTAWQEGLLTNENGKIDKGDENAWSILKYHPDTEGILAFNRRTGNALILSDPPWFVPEGRKEEYPMTLQDSDAGEIAIWLSQATGGTSFGADRALKSALGLAHQNSFDPFVTYLEGLVWDGTPRLATWLIDYAGAEDTPHNRAVGENWLTALVARTIKEGAKVDTMLVLVGGQGIGKSSLLRAIVPWEDLFTDDLRSDEKDRIIDLSRFAVVEMAELSGLSRKDNAFVKSLLSGQVASVRRPYGRLNEHFPRRAVFAGTTNEENGFLNDPTGARRFWIVPVTQCNPGAFTAVRDQVLAEAVHRYKTVGRWYLTKEEEVLAKEVQEQYRTVDVDLEKLESYLTIGIPRAQRRLYKDKKEGSLNDVGDVLMYAFEDQFGDDSDIPRYLSTEQVCDLLWGDNHKNYSTRAVNLLSTLKWASRGKVRKEGKRFTFWTYVG